MLVHGSMQKCIKKKLGHFTLPKYIHRGVKCRVFLSRSLPVRGAVDRSEEAPRRASIAPVLDTEVERASCPASLRVHEQIEGEISPGPAAARTALLSCSIDDRGRPRPAAEESLICWGTGLHVGVC